MPGEPWQPEREAIGGDRFRQQRGQSGRDGGQAADAEQCRRAVAQQKRETIGAQRHDAGAQGAQEREIGKTE